MTGSSDDWMTQSLAAWPEAARGLWESLQKGSGALPVAPLLTAPPALGPTREDQEAWQRFGTLSSRVAAAQQRLAGAWMDIQQRAFAELGEEVAARAKRGEPVSSLRSLYDLWIDAAERVHGKIVAASPYVELQAELANATSALRIAERELLERWLRQYDVPTRAELDSVHRQLRELSQQRRPLTESPAPRAQPKPKPKPKLKLKAALKANARRRKRGS